MKSILAVGCLCLFLVSCGGGSENTQAPAPLIKEGLYMGTSFNFPDLGGQPTSILVLDQQEIWVLDGRTPAKFFGQGKFAFTGKGSLSNGSAADVFFQPKALVAIDSNQLGERGIELRFGAVNGTPFAMTPQSAQVNELHASLSPISSYDYNKPARVADVAGSWGSTVSDTSFYLGSEPLEVSVTGGITVPQRAGGCSAVGALKPRNDGKNVFDLSMTVSECADAGEYVGIAFSYLDTGFVGAIPCLRLIATNSAKTRLFNLTSTR